MSLSGSDRSNTEQIMQTMARFVDITLNSSSRDYGFCLLVFPRQRKLDQGPIRANYVANSSRAEMIKALKEVADRLEADSDIDQVISFPDDLKH